MSTDATNGQPPEQHSEPMAEAGCEDKIDRSVQGTVVSTGFAELRSRAMQKRADAVFWAARHKLDGRKKRHAKAIERAKAFDTVLQWIDELSGCEERDKAGGRRPTSMAVP